MEPWELLALVKARPAAGDEDLLHDYFEMLEPILWRQSLTADAVRGILCIRCNNALGLLRERGELAAVAVDYLESGDFMGKVVIRLPAP